jgi:hypothetical protein
LLLFEKTLLLSQKKTLPKNSTCGFLFAWTLREPKTEMRKSMKEPGVTNPHCAHAMPQPQQVGQDWQLGSALELLSAQQSLHAVIKHQEVCQAALGCLSYGAGWRFQPANT